MRPDNASPLFKRPRLIVLALGLLACFAALETGLSLANGFFLRKNLRFKAPPRDGATRILCLGDSHTFGMGEKPENTYPAQLSHALDREYPGRFRVINAGLPGYNTAQTLRALKTLWHDVTPSMVLVWSGNSNHWNFSDIPAGENRGRFSRLKSFWNNLHTVRLFGLLLANLENRAALRSFSSVPLPTELPSFPGHRPELSFPPPPEGKSAGALIEEAVDLQNRGQGEKARRLLEESLQTGPSRFNAAVACAYLGWIDCEERNFDRALRWFDYGLHTDASVSLNYYGAGLAFLRSGKDDEARRWFVRAFALNPENPGGHPDLFETLARTRDTARTLAELVPAQKVSAPVGRICALLSSGPEAMASRINAWARADLASAAAFCRERGASVVFFTYPDPRPVSPAIRELATRLGVPLVDCERLFASLPGGCAAFIGRDGEHLDARGYRVLVDEILRVLRSNRLLPAR